jgi:hypothetical protein
VNRFASFASCKACRRSSSPSWCGIPQSTISGIETGRINLGVERAKTLAIALRCHPAVLVFPGWQVAA